MLLLIVLPGLHGCGGPRADTSSPEASFTSLRAMYAALPASRRDELRWAVEVVGSDELNDRVRRAAFGEIASIGDRGRSALDGRTAAQIVALARERCAGQDHAYPICHDPFLVHVLVHVLVRAPHR
jgi:hypothetical protein